MNTNDFFFLMIVMSIILSWNGIFMNNKFLIRKQRLIILNKLLDNL